MCEINVRLRCGLPVAQGQQLLDVYPSHPTVAGGVCSGCAQWWWAHKVHTVQTLLCTPRPAPPTSSVAQRSHPCAPPVLSSRSSPWVRLKLPLVEFRSVWRPNCSANMVRSGSICRFLLLVLLGLMVAFVHTGKPSFYVQSALLGLFFGRAGDKCIIGRCLSLCGCEIKDVRSGFTSHLFLTCSHMCTRESEVGCCSYWGAEPWTLLCLTDLFSFILPDKNKNHIKSDCIKLV